LLTKLPYCVCSQVTGSWQAAQTRPAIAAAINNVTTGHPCTPCKCQETSRKLSSFSVYRPQKLLWQISEGHLFVWCNLVSQCAECSAALGVGALAIRAGHRTNAADSEALLAGVVASDGGEPLLVFPCRWKPILVSFVHTGGTRSSPTALRRHTVAAAAAATDSSAAGIRQAGSCAPVALQAMVSKARVANSVLLAATPVTPLPRIWWGLKCMNTGRLGRRRAWGVRTSQLGAAAGRTKPRGVYQCFNFVGLAQVRERSLSSLCTSCIVHDLKYRIQS
jgi:hypothetical protein